MPSTPIQEWELQEKIGKLLPSQRLFIFHAARFSALAGGTGSGKTRAAIIKALMLSSIFPGNAGIIGRFHGTTMSDSVIPLFFEVCPPSWIKTHTGGMQTGANVTLRNGSMVMFRHIHDPKAGLSAKTRRMGANLGWFFIDQLEELDAAHWNAMITRLRRPLKLRSDIAARLASKGIDPESVNKHYGFGALNPNGHDWIYHTFFPGFRKWDMGGTLGGKYYQLVVPNPDTVGIAVNSEENRKSKGGFVDDEYFDSMLEAYTPELRDRYIWCSFDDFSGKIYKDYQAGIDNEQFASVHNVEPFSIPSHWELIVGIDVGGAVPWAVSPCYVDEYGSVVVAQGFHGKINSVSELAAWIKGNLPWNQRRTRFVIDPENKLAATELAEYGIYALPAVKGQGSVVSGIARVQGYMKVRKGWALPSWYTDTQPRDVVGKFAREGSPRIFVFKTNREWRSEHDGYRWDENKRNEPKKQDDHACDATRYALQLCPEPSKLVRPETGYGEMRGYDPGAARYWEAFDKRVKELELRGKGWKACSEANSEEAEGSGVMVGGGYEWE